MSEIVLVLRSVLSAAGTFCTAWSQYRAARTQRRIEQVQALLMREVTNIEERFRQLEHQHADADLFLATLHSLVQDDEEAKTCFYAAFLGHLLTKSTDRAELTRIAECFKSLSSVELNYLAGADETGKLANIREDWIEVSLPASLQSLGLFVNPIPVVYETRLTSVGLLARSIAIEGTKAFAPGNGEPLS